MSGSATRTDASTAAAWIRDAAHTRLGRAFWSALMEMLTCADPAEQSALDLFQQFRTIGELGAFATAEESTFAAGAGSIADGLAAELADRIHLGAPVRRVEHDGHGARVFSDREEWSARRVIVTVPPVLVPKISFSPALPEARIALQRHVVPARTIKSVLVFERAFWRDAGASGMSMTQTAPVGVTFDGSPPSGRPGILVALTTGRQAARLGSLEPGERRAVVLAHARRLFPMLDGEPEACLECDWSAEEWSGGAYGSRLAPGAWTRCGAALREPVGPIHWAGSETALEWRSYMEGAVESGERAAGEVMSLEEGR